MTTPKTNSLDDYAQGTGILHNRDDVLAYCEGVAHSLRDGGLTLAAQAIEVLLGFIEQPESDDD